LRHRVALGRGQAIPARRLAVVVAHGLHVAEEQLRGDFATLGQRQPFGLRRFELAAL